MHDPSHELQINDRHALTPRKDWLIDGQPEGHGLLFGFAPQDAIRPKERLTASVEAILKPEFRDKKKHKEKHDAMKKSLCVIDVFKLDPESLMTIHENGPEGAPIRKGDHVTAVTSEPAEEGKRKGHWFFKFDFDGMRDSPFDLPGTYSCEAHICYFHEKDGEWWVIESAKTWPQTVIIHD